MPGMTKSRKNMFAEESLKTQKARAKLIRRFGEHEKKITPEELEKKAVEIHRWIARHAPNRVALKAKSISLFDENQNTAKLSRRVAQLAESIQQELSSISQQFNAQIVKPKVLSDE